LRFCFSPNTRIWLFKPLDDIQEGLWLYVTYPTGLPHREGESNYVSILMLYKKYKSDTESILNSLTNEQFILINNKKSNEIFSIKSKNINRCENMVGFIKDNSGYSVFFCESYNKNIAVYRSITENIFIRYYYNPSEIVSHEKIDEFVTTYIRSHIIKRN